MDLKKLREICENANRHNSYLSEIQDFEKHVRPHEVLKLLDVAEAAMALHKSVNEELSVRKNEKTFQAMLGAMYRFEALANRDVEVNR